jgi:hypothetical protein
MKTIQLIRKSRQGKAVYGNLSLQMRNREYVPETFTIQTIENADFLIPAGTYPLERTWSPKFKKFLPILNEVPDREGIRIHRGSLPEHSKGCILTDIYGMSILDVFFNQTEREEESVQIEITNEEEK